MALYTTGHGLRGIEFGGRFYPAAPSPVKKTNADDETLLTVHRTQFAPFNSKARFRVVVAGRRWGKTHWTCIELILAAAKKPNQVVWYVAPTYGMAYQIAWSKLKEIIPRKWIKKGIGGYMINETRMSITLRNNSVISLKGADAPDTLRGNGVDFLILDEYQDFKTGTWEMVLRATLSDKQGRAVFIGTPKSFNQLYDMYMRGQPDANGKKNPQWSSWQFMTADSPFVPFAELDQAREDLDPKTFNQEYEASFESMAGLVYYDFDRRLNVKSLTYDPSMPLMIGQDFNVDPMSSILLQKHGDELWAVGELNLRSSSTEDVCRALIDEYGWGILDKATVYPDPSGNNRSSARGDSDVQIFREWGFNRILNRKRAPFVRDRIAAVNRQICDAKGKRRMFVDPTCTELIKGFEQLIYKEGTSDPDKSLGIEHMTDAVGYPIEFEFPVKHVHTPQGYSR